MREKEYNWVCGPGENNGDSSIPIEVGTDQTPKWVTAVLDDPVKILEAAKCCMDTGVMCSVCPFKPWYNCFDILKQKIDELINKEKGSKRNDR